MKIQWLGHACFRLTSEEGTAVVCDPFEGSVGYPVPQVQADIVCCSHEHFDHTNAAALRGNPQVLRTEEPVTIGGVSVFGVPCYHDPAQGALRGKNMIYVLDIDGVRVVHMGDIGHMLDEAQLEALGKVDVLLMPVGGTFTVDAEGASTLCDAIGARIVVPMHYQTDRLTLSATLLPVADFLALRGAHTRLTGDTFIVRRGDGLAGVIVPQFAD